MPSELWGSSMLEGEILVPHINIHITQQQLFQLRQTIDPLGYSGNHGIDIYQRCLAFVQIAMSIDS